nr:cell division protein FtsQ/DivIB [Aestuariivivens sediminis]
MRVNWSFLKIVFLLGLLVFLFGFASIRNKARTVTPPNIKFIGENNLFITNQTVSKLLIQNQHGVKNVLKETLDLNELERALNSNPMIKSAEVFVSVNGTLNADIEQKTPIARVHTNASYYIDDEGAYMPLSVNYSARVPLISGYVEKNNLNNIYKVAKTVHEDDFLKKNVIEIYQNNKKEIFLKLRRCDFVVKLGTIELLDKKINNLKVFYKKNLKEHTLSSYSVINLQFDNQVVCTKT